jgi:hypothetical protein
VRNKQEIMKLRETHELDHWLKEGPQL